MDGWIAAKLDVFSPVGLIVPTYPIVLKLLSSFIPVNEKYTLISLVVASFPITLAVNLEVGSVESNIVNGFLELNASKAVL